VPTQQSDPSASPNGESIDVAKLLPNAVNGMELRMVRLDDILIPEDRHKRRGRRHKDQLGGSMDAIGLDSPVLLSPIGEGKFSLVAGGGRLENAREKGWSEIHAIVKVRDEQAQAASTAAENMAREDLSPAEEADAIELMIKAGDSPREAAEKVGLTPQTGTLRMALVEMPEEIRAAFHHDGLPASLAAEVKKLYDGNNAIGLEIGALGLADPDSVAAALSNGAREFFRQLDWLHKAAKLRGKAPFIAAFHRGSEHGRGLSWDPNDPQRIKLKGKSAKWFIERCDAATYSYQLPKIVLSEEDLDQAAAIGVAYHSKGEHGMVWVHDRKWLTDQINEFVLPRMQAEAEAKAKETPLSKLKKAVKGKVELAKMTASELAPTLERRFKRELQPKAYAANVELGLALTGKLAVKKLTREHALFFAYEVLGRENKQNAFVRAHEHGARRVAECAARVMADWIAVESKTLKSGKIKTTVIYLDGHAAEKRMWDYIKAAKSPEEILQRTLHVYAAAAFFKRECGPNGKEPMNQFPLNATAGEALEKIVKPIVPMAVKRIEREIREYDATKQAEAMIEEAKAEAKKQGTTATATRGKGSPSHKARAVDIIEQQPGITIPELAAKMSVKQNYFYKALPALERDGKLAKKGRGWYPVATSTSSSEAQADTAELPQAA
jgi:ParB/RepB/Spo0J family partition protein